MKKFDFNEFKLNTYKINNGFHLVMYSPVISTERLPQTTSVLKSELPTIMNSMCFNPKNLPFSEEVKNTETGHLFEHILLEYLCEEKSKDGGSNFMFEGNTDWNWQKFPEGYFDIYIKYKEKVPYYFNRALDNTISLFRTILNTSNNALQAASLPPVANFLV